MVTDSVMTASKPKYYFRKKARCPAVTTRTKHHSSSTESDDFVSLVDDSSRITMHVITEQGQSEAVKKSFKNLTERLDPTFDVVCVSESSSPSKMKDKRSGSTTPQVPALAVILFFMCDIASEDPVEAAKMKRSDSDNSTDELFKVDTRKRKNAFYEARRTFSKKPWRFHHKVAVSGKLVCDANVQDYFQYETSNQQRRRGSNGRATPSLTNERTQHLQLPLWAVRKVHYGKQILRFNIFVSYENWAAQIELYSLVLKVEAQRVRDDFCFFETFSNLTSTVQLGLKRLPVNLKPQRLKSSILQFKVQNVGQLVPLLPHSCEPISELRWRTRDHDSNLILLQIKRSCGDGGELPVESLFSDGEGCRSQTPIPRCPTPKPHIPVPRPRTIRYFETSNSPNKTRPKFSPEIKRDSSDPDLKGYNSDDSALGDSFVCPSLPDKMPLIKPTLYSLPKTSPSASVNLTERLRGNNKLLRDDVYNNSNGRKSAMDKSLDPDDDVTKPTIVESEDGDIYI
ncbi:protein FAM124B-like isoform X1 [Ciona intestinalis]